MHQNAGIVLSDAFGRLADRLAIVLQETLAEGDVTTAQRLRTAIEQLSRAAASIAVAPPIADEHDVWRLTNQLSFQANQLASAGATLPQWQNVGWIGMLGSRAEAVAQSVVAGDAATLVSAAAALSSHLKDLGGGGQGPRGGPGTFLGEAVPAESEYEYIEPDESDDEAEPGIAGYGIVEEAPRPRTRGGFGITRGIGMGIGPGARPERSAPPPQRQQPQAQVAPDAQAEPSTTPEPAPSHTAYARIEMRSEMKVGGTAPLVVGLAPVPQPNVVGGAITIKSNYPYALQLTVMAEGFTLGAGESWTNTLTVAETNPYPVVELHLTALADGPQRRIIGVFYTVNDETVGYAGFPVTVRKDDAAAAGDGPKRPAQAVVSTVNTPYKPDLTIQISEFEDGTGRLGWSFISPHIPVPTEPIPKSIGKGPEQFAVGLINEIFDVDPELTQLTLRGIGTTIAGAIPAQFKDVWRQLRDAIGARTPTVLILSAEPYVPWELAAVAPLFDPAAPPFLGAQADVGRWILDSNADLPLPPPFELALQPMAEVTAVYDPTIAPALPAAVEEGQALRKLYKAEHVSATGKAITSCFHKATPPADLLHIALHGEYNAVSPLDGLVMASGKPLTASAIRGGSADRTPFIFLNACQVGTGKLVLGAYAGIPAAFVYGKARGVIAPLWSVDDRIAKEIALRFYEGLSRNETPASLLRAERKRFVGDTASPTYLAYVYFGNPSSHVPAAASTG